MAYHDKIRLNLPRKPTNFVSGLTSHQLGDRIEAELLQSLHALIEDPDEGILHLSGCPGVNSLSQHQPAGGF